jgi:hypothetical protein
MDEFGKFRENTVHTVLVFTLMEETDRGATKSGKINLIESWRNRDRWCGQDSSGTLLGPMTRF